MIILLIAYGITRLQTMLDFGDNVIQEPNEERYFDLDFVFDQDFGFSVAFGLTTYDQNDEVYDDSYGRVVAKQKIWGEKDENGEIKPLYFRDLEIGPCDRSLFLFGDEDDDESKAIFFQASSDYLSDVKRILPKLQCVNDNKIEVRGDYNSDHGSQFVVQFETCDEEANEPGFCKSREVIEQWMRRKFLVTYYNQMTFQKNEVEKETHNKYEKYGKLVWNVITPQMRLDYYKYIDLTELKLQDEPWSLGFDTVETIDIFSIRQGEVRPYDYFDSVQLSITFELDRDLRVVKRNVYIFMDWLGDIGGLAGSLYALFGALVIIFQYKIVYSFIGQNTFLIRDGEERVPPQDTASVRPSSTQSKEGRDQTKENGLKKIPIGFCGAIKLSLQRLLFDCACCKSRRDKLSHMAVHSVKDELQIVEWVKFKRITEAAILDMISPEKLAQLQRDYEFKVLKIQDEDETSVKAETVVVGQSSVDKERTQNANDSFNGVSSEMLGA